MRFSDGFIQGLGSALFNWWGFIFTVGGTILSLWFAREHWWICLLIVGANAIACGSFAYTKQKGEVIAKARHEDALVRLQEAERKLNEVPLELLTRVRQIVASVSLVDVARILSSSAALVTRHRQFVAVEAKPLTLRTFARQGDRLFAVAKAARAALENLRVDDPFLLQKKSSSGVEVVVARLAVHQPPDLVKEVAYFAVLPPIPSELEAIAALAVERNVKGVTDYSVRPAYDITRYRDLDLTPVPEAIDLLIEDAVRGNAGDPP